MEINTAPYNKDEIADLVSDEFDWDMYPYVVMTIDTEWDLCILDEEFTLLGNEEFLTPMNSLIKATLMLSGLINVASVQFFTFDPIL